MKSLLQHHYFEFGGRAAAAALWSKQRNATQRTAKQRKRCKKEMRRLAESGNGCTAMKITGSEVGGARWEDT